MQKTNPKNLFNMYKPIFYCMLLFGFNLNFLKPKLFQIIIIKIYALFLIILLLASLYQHMTNISSTLNFCQYLAIAIFFCIYKSKTVDFFSRLTTLDCYLRIRPENNLLARFYVILLTFFMFFTRILYTYCQSAQFSDLTLKTHVLYTFLLVTFDATRSWCLILLYLIRYRLKYLRIRLEESPEDHYLYVLNNKCMREAKIKFLTLLYKKLADNVDVIATELFTMIFINIVCSFPNLIIYVYVVLLEIEENMSALFIFTKCLRLIHLLFFLTIPCIMTELMIVEVEKIKKYLYNELIVKRDPETKEDINLFLKYIELRSYNLKIFNFIPLGLQQPIAFINACTNYVIVIANFTHMYDYKN